MKELNILLRSNNLKNEGIKYIGKYIKDLNNIQVLNIELI